MARRQGPFELVFGSLAEERFPRLREGLLAAGRDPRDRDAFLLVQEVGELLRELRPDGGLGAEVGGLVALVHAAYRYWADGQEAVPVGEAALQRVLSGGATGPAPTNTAARYIQLPLLRVWGTPVEGGSAEPLDGWFVTRRGPELSLVAVFGLHPGREGLTVVEASGPRPGALAREDGTPLFAPTLAGGAEAGLASVIGEEELLELAWRLEEQA